MNTFNYSLSFFHVLAIPLTHPFTHCFFSIFYSRFHWFNHTGWRQCCTPQHTGIHTTWPCLHVWTHWSGKGDHRMRQHAILHKYTFTLIKFEFRSISQHVLFFALISCCVRSSERFTLSWQISSSLLFCNSACCAASSHGVRHHTLTSSPQCT